MLQAVFLDSGPLGLATQKRGVAEADACRQWMNGLLSASVRVIVPEVADFEKCDANFCGLEKQQRSRV